MALWFLGHYLVNFVFCVISPSETPVAAARKSNFYSQVEVKNRSSCSSYLENSYVEVLVSRGTTVHIF